eukprot:scaffold14295_cov161-Skeletonema_marinoi.AAC.5
MDVVLQLCSLHVSTDGSYVGNGGSASSICPLHSPLANDYSNLLLEMVKWANEHMRHVRKYQRKLRSSWNIFCG